jgi:hypothetical protein
MKTELYNGKVLGIDLNTKMVMVSLAQEGKNQEIVEMPVAMFPDDIQKGQHFKYGIQSESDSKLHHIQYVS